MRSKFFTLVIDNEKKIELLFLLVEFRKHFYIITFDQIRDENGMTTAKITDMGKYNAFSEWEYFLQYGNEKDYKKEVFE